MPRSRAGFRRASAGRWCREPAGGKLACQPLTMEVLTWPSVSGINADSVAMSLRTCHSTARRMIRTGELPRRNRLYRSWGCPSCRRTARFPCRNGHGPARQSDCAAHFGRFRIGFPPKPLASPRAGERRAREGAARGGVTRLTDHARRTWGLTGPLALPASVPFAVPMSMADYNRGTAVTPHAGRNEPLEFRL